MLVFFLKTLSTLITPSTLITSSTLIILIIKNRVLN